MAIVKDRSIDAMMDMIREDLAAAQRSPRGVFLRTVACMPTMPGAIRKAIAELTMAGHIYKGKLPPPKGQKPDDWEDREQTLFRVDRRPATTSTGHW